MPPDSISWLAVVVILCACVGLVLIRDWRWALALLAGQYLAAFWLVSIQWPIGLASVKLVTGWMSIAALGITRLGMPIGRMDEKSSPQRIRFEAFLVAIMALLAGAAAPGILSLLPGLKTPVAVGSALLISLGLLHLGLTTDVLRVILALLTVLSGFEILYAAVEGSILVAGLLSIVNLGLGLVGAYLLLAQAEEATP